MYGAHDGAHHLVDQVRILVQQVLEAGPVQAYQLAVPHGTQSGRVLDTVDEAHLSDHVTLTQDLQRHHGPAAGLGDRLHP